MVEAAKSYRRKSTWEVRPYKEAEPCLEASSSAYLEEARILVVEEGSHQPFARTPEGAYPWEDPSAYRQAEGHQAFPLA